MHLSGDPTNHVVFPAGWEVRRFCGTIPAEILGHLASVCDPLEAASLISLWDASVRCNQWHEWRTVAAYVQDQLQGAVVARVQPGGLATVWPPRTVPSRKVDLAAIARLIRPPAEDDFDAELAQWEASNGTALGPAPQASWSMEDQLVHCMLEELEQAHTTLVQAILPLQAVEDALVLLRGGFTKLAELVYMQWGAEALAAAPSLGTLSCRPYKNDDAQLLNSILAASYEQSLDCPALTGLQHPSDILTGYQQTGQTGTAGWRIVIQNAQPVGCLLLAGHNDQTLAELVYMGVLPAFRGKGFGQQLVRLAQRIAGEWGAEQLVLAVDQANFPALNIYHSCGFQEFDYRQAFILRGKKLRSAALSPPCEKSSG